MRTKSYWVFIIITLTGCNQQASKTDATDSTQLHVNTTKTDTITSVEVPESDEPEDNEPPIDASFLTTPEFSVTASTFSDNKSEESIVNAFLSLVSEFQKEKFATIKMEYNHDDAVTMGRVSEAETWYYNAERKLCAYTTNYKSDRTDMGTIYLLENENVVGAFSSSSFQDEGASYDNSMILVSSLCPRCGVSLANDDGEGYTITELDQSSLSKYADDFIKSHEDKLKTYKSVIQISKQGESYMAFIYEHGNSGTDTIKYFIDPNLIHKFFRNSKID